MHDAGQAPGSDPELPRYDDLPPAAQGGRSGWHVFGEQDSLGLVNLQTDTRVHAAASLVRKGMVFPLNAALDGVDPPIDKDRGMPRQRVLHQPDPGYEDLDDVIDNFYPQTSSQWDSLAHVAYSPGIFYNGATDADVTSGRRNTIDFWARRGIAARGVLLDLARTIPGYSPEGSTAFGVADLERARERAGVEFSPGCVLLLHTGFLHWYQGRPRRERVAVAADLRAPGVEHTEEMARYLWDSQVMAVACDTYAVEVWPPAWADMPFGFLHRVLIGQLGMALGELWWLHDLAADCAQDGVCEFFLTSAPLNSRGGIGSPPNALAIK